MENKNNPVKSLGVGSFVAGFAIAALGYTLFPHIKRAVLNCIEKRTQSVKGMESGKEPPLAEEEEKNDE